MLLLKYFKGVIKLDDQNNTLQTDQPLQDNAQSAPQESVLEQTAFTQETEEIQQEEFVPPVVPQSDSSAPEQPETETAEEQIPSVEVGPEDNQDTRVQTIPEEKPEVIEPVVHAEPTPIGNADTGRPAGFTPKVPSQSEVAQTPAEEPKDQTATPKIQWKKPILTIVIISIIAVGIMLLLNSMN